MTWTMTERLEWGAWATPKPVKDTPVHRWLLFPHSFAKDLVCELIAEWNLAADDRVLDPFVGSGTTPLAAKDAGISCDGFDLSPLAVLVSRTKLANYDDMEMRDRGEELKTWVKRGWENLGHNTTHNWFGRRCPMGDWKRLTRSLGESKPWTVQIVGEIFFGWGY